MKIVFFLFVYFSFYTFQCTYSMECEFATANKYIGIFSVKSGTGNVKPYNKSFVSNPEECKSKCRVDDRCYAASLENTNNCMFYNTSHIDISMDLTEIFYLWLPCPWHYSYIPKDGRCKGLFVRYFNKAITVSHGYLILDKIERESVEGCHYRCTSHPLCRVYMHNNNSRNCQLHQMWPFESTHEITSKEFNMFKWTCIPDYVDTITISKIPSKPNSRACTGVWNIVASNATISDVTSPGTYFFTQSYEACLSECNEHAGCNVALFNASSALCVLPHIESADTYSYLQKISFIDFRWRCLTNDSTDPQMNEQETRFVAMGLECVTLVDTKDVYIAEDHCGHIPNVDKFQKCDTPHNIDSRKHWTASDSCLVNQSFWKFPSIAFSQQPNNGTLRSACKICTGLTYFWISFPINSIFIKASFLECRRFYSAKSTDSMTESDIFTRAQWYAYPPQGDQKPFTKKPKHIVIAITDAPHFGCRTTAACTSILRWLQIFYFNGDLDTQNYNQIPYNFLLDESGNVYEGRGWHKQCAGVLTYNINSLCFAFIGSFKDFYPPIAFVKSLKKLIEYAIKNKYVDDNYTLYNNQDLSKDKVSRNLEIIDKNWYRYRGYIPPDCVYKTTASLPLNGLLIVFLIIYLSVVLRKLFYEIKPCKNCEFVKLLKFEKVQKIDVDLIPHYNYSKSYLITEKKFLPRADNKSKIIKLIRIWILNSSKKTVSSRQEHYQLATYLDMFANSSQGVNVYEAYYDDKENIFAVLCLDDDTTFRRFRYSMDRCLCRYFCITAISSSSVEIERVLEIDVY